jgi:hypothetical protein
MNVPPEATQPSADELVSYEDFLLRLDRLRASPRVRVKKLGESHGKRGLYVILVASEEAIPHLEHHRMLSTALQMPEILLKNLSQIEMAKRPPAGQDVKFPALITGLSFGHEASHVEAHLALAEQLAWGDDEEVKAILARIIVLIMPMLNPDGRAMSVDIWRQYPLAEDSSAGNLYGFYLNRDFLHLTQPEARAVARVYQEWHPIALLDTHEDVFCLGVEVPETCWCPHSGHAPVEDAPDNILNLISHLGEAIREEWARHGLKALERNMFAHPMPGEPEEGPYWIALGNVVEAMALHGMPSVITESGRTPGVQAWEDRVQQKYLAGMALLTELAKHPRVIAEAMYANRKEAIESAQQAKDAFLIRKKQDKPGAVGQLVDTLLQQGISVYQTAEPYEAFVVPLAQAEQGIARTLLSAETSKLAAMPPALGVAVIRLGSLSKQDANTMLKAELTPLIAPPVPRVIILGEPEERDYAIPNSGDGVRLVNRLWHADSDVRWLAEPLELGPTKLDRGSFLVRGISRSALQTLGQGLTAEVHGVAECTRPPGRPLQRPKVALYFGQGVDRPDASARADIWWALDRLGFGFVPLTERDVNASTLAHFDIVLFPGGDAEEIVRGWDTNAPLNSAPWELPGERRGIGQEGLESLRQYVKGGGHYLGMGSGGGLLALSDYADLIDVEVMAHSLGTARVLLRVEQGDNPLMLGLNGYYDEHGEWVEGYFPAQYHSETFTDRPGGPIFKAGRACTPLATYYRVEHDPQHLQVINEAHFTETHGGVAVATQQVGRGRVSVVGVCPGFRAVWTNTWKLISNAIFMAVAGEDKEATLP